MSVAQEIGPSAVRYAEKLLGDPALAITLFEEAAATVSQTHRERAARGKPDVKDMRGYLFLAYIRCVRKERRAEPVAAVPCIEQLEKVKGLAATNLAQDDSVWAVAKCCL